jgi:hypothetical protein
MILRIEYLRPLLLAVLVCGAGCGEPTSRGEFGVHAVIVYGNVRDEDGTAVAGARIEAETFYAGCSSAPRSGTGEAFTNLSGSYRLEIVSASPSSQCAIVRVRRGMAGEVVATHEFTAPRVKERRSGVVPDSIRFDFILQP